MNGMPMGQYYPVDTSLHRMDARAKLIAFILLLVAVVATAQPLGYVALGLVVMGLVWRSGLPVSLALGALGRIWKFLVIIFLMNALFFDSSEPLWQWWIFRLSTVGMLQGVRVASSVAILMVVSSVLMGTTPPAELTGALASLLKPLSVIGVPVADVAMIITVAIRFIPTLMEETDAIKKAQTARGARFDSPNLTKKAAAVAPLVVPIFLSAIRRADELAMAMEARGYRGGKGRTAPIKRPLTKADWGAMAVCLLYCVIQILLFR